MKNILKTMAFVLTTVLFVGCNDVTTDGFTKITYYPSITVLGDAVMAVQLGETFEDPGATAFEGETDITGNIKVTGSVNTSKIGFYTITYQAVNVDGFPASSIRKVCVYDPTVTTDISGSYKVDIDNSSRYQFSNGAIIKYSDMGSLYGGDFSNFTVDLVQFLPGIFTVSDFFGGYYVAGRNYDAKYLMGGYVALNKDNSLKVLDSLVPGWGDSLNDLVDASYDPATGTVKWGATYGGAYSFDVVLNKK